LGRVIALEHPELHCLQVDLDPASSTAEIGDLFAEICSGTGEIQIAIRQGTRYVPRLIHAPQSQVALDEIKWDGFQPDRTYLITGGRGGLGLQVARWMVEKGARHLVLVGRSEPTEAVRQAVNEMERSDARIMLAQADVAQTEQVAHLLVEIERSMPPLRGIVHAAGVLDDGILSRQEWKRFARVFAPKIQGAWNLHELTSRLPLDFFVLFSSTAALLGSPGQGNYAAGNAFLDALAYYRRAKGLCALSINWGAWAEVGMAATQQGINERISLFGMEAIDPQQGLNALEQIWQQDPVQMVVMPVDWRQMLDQLSGEAEPPLLSDLLQKVRAQQKDLPSAPQFDLLSKLDQALPNSRRRVLVNLMCEQARRVLGLETDFELDVRQPLNELGLNSLMALELRKTLNSALGRTLPATVLFDHPTIEGLSNYLADEVLHLPSSQETPDLSPAAVREKEAQAKIEAEIKKLSIDELAALAAEELEAVKMFAGE
jgi:NAD(P)-dependent dehydrogenase (short-subunit alcohol dehydrogenase family)/acyl carrier protein